MTRICPCCHQPIAMPNAPIEALKAAPVVATSRTILLALVRAYPETVNSSRLVDLIYEGARLPADPEKSMRVHLARARKAALKSGWTIVNAMTKGRGVRGEYKLEPLP